MDKRSKNLVSQLLGLKNGLYIKPSELVLVEHAVTQAIDCVRGSEDTLKAPQVVYLENKANELLSKAKHGINKVDIYKRRVRRRFPRLVNKPYDQKLLVKSKTANRIATVAAVTMLAGGTGSLIAAHFSEGEGCRNPQGNYGDAVVGNPECTNREAALQAGSIVSIGGGFWLGTIALSERPPRIRLSRAEQESRSHGLARHL